VDMTKYQPTAKEIFELRSACADLGQKILDDDVHSPELYVEQVSHYNPSTNRCYVEVTSSYSGKEIRRYLYDGQTKEMLASTTWKGWGNRGGMVFDKQHPYSPQRADDGGYDDADNYINTMMADDRSI